MIGKEARKVKAADAWNYVAALTAGQDLSERVGQMNVTPPQFSLGKSHPGFAPMGPVLVTVDEFENPDDIEVSCSINGETVQKSRTSDLVFSVPDLIERLSHNLTLLPGDVIFTGDMNDRQDYFCDTVENGSLYAANGGSVGPRRPPVNVEIDWIMGTPTVTFSNYLAEPSIKNSSLAALAGVGAA